MSATQAWELESFLDSLIVELDRAQDTLALKGMTRRLTYTVQDVALDMHIFPQFDRGRLRFTAAAPGETGASRISIQLGSITDRQIREVATEPPRPDDVTLESVEGIDEQSRDVLQRIGVRTARDLERLDRGAVDVERVVAEKGGRDFDDLSRLINRARRRQRPPSVSAALAVEADEGPRLVIDGTDLVPPDHAAGYPVAAVDGHPVEILEASENRLVIALPASGLSAGSHRLAVALDPYADFSCTIRA